MTFKASYTCKFLCYQGNKTVIYFKYEIKMKLKKGVMGTLDLPLVCQVTNTGDQLDLWLVSDGGQAVLCDWAL